MVSALLAWGCGGEDASAPTATTSTSQDAGAGGCGPGTVPLDDGTCRPAGVAECGVGFDADDTGGCVPVLPPAPCEPGAMAVPGDSACRPPAPCVDPVDEPGAQHVDAGYTGGGSDGSAAKPWTTIQDAIGAAQQGALVAVGPGSYLETPHVSGKRVRIVGRCPADVELVGGATASAALRLTAGSDGSEIRGVAITGSNAGILADGAKDLVLEGLWIHDTGNVGLQAQSTGAATSVALRDVLFERNDRRGVVLISASGQVERVEVRDVGIDADGSGFGFLVVSQEAHATASIASSRVERAAGVGIGGAAADLDITATLVRDTVATGVGIDQRGRGLEVQDDGPGRRSRLTARALVIERSLDVGLLVFGSDAVIENTVVRDTAASDDGRRGVGFSVENDFVTGELANAELRWLLAERNHSAGALVIGSTALFEGLAVRDGLPTPAHGGRGLEIEDDRDTGDRAVVTVRQSAFERHQEVGVFVGGSDLTFEASLVRDIEADAQGHFGDCVTVVSVPGAHGSLTVRDSLLANGARAGLGVFGSSAEVAGTRFECNAFAIDGERFADTDYGLVDLGSNVCGCKDSSVPCEVLSASLEAPEGL